MLRAGHPTLTPLPNEMGEGGAISQCSEQPRCCLTPLIPISQTKGTPVIIWSSGMPIISENLLFSFFLIEIVALSLLEMHTSIATWVLAVTNTYSENSF